MLLVAFKSTVRKFCTQWASFQLWSGSFCFQIKRFELASWSSIRFSSLPHDETVFFFSVDFWSKQKTLMRVRRARPVGVVKKLCMHILSTFFFLINVRKQLWQKKWVGRKLRFNFAMIQNPQIVAFERFFHQIWLEKEMKQTWVINLIFLSRQTSDNALLENKLQFVHHTHFGGMSHLSSFTWKYDIPLFCHYKE